MNTSTSKRDLAQGLIITNSSNNCLIEFFSNLRTVFIATIPVWFALLVHVLAQTVNLYFLSRSDPSSEILAAIGLGMTLNNALLRSFIYGYNSGMVTIVSQAAGQDLEEEAAETFNRTLVSSTWYMILMGGLMIFMQMAILWMGVDPEIASIT